MNIYENVKEKGIEDTKTVSISSTRDKRVRGKLIT